mmetsp:Transcript_68938/g.175202  ORF Transcript_68938/g.175202 Transcript_68938/m.175202 type:complete len:179 (-) Transcript_68938:58-594(-)
MCPGAPELDLCIKVLVSTICAIPACAVVKLRNVAGQADALAHAALGGILGSMTLVAGKTLISRLQAPDFTVLSVIPYCIVAALVCPLHLFVLNRGFGRHSLVFLSPAQGALGLLANVTTGFCLYSEVPVSTLGFCLGVALLLMGVVVLCSKKQVKCASRGDPDFVQSYGEVRTQRLQA